MPEKQHLSEELADELAVSAQMLLSDLELNPDLFEEVRNYLEAKLMGYHSPKKSADLKAFLRDIKQEAANIGVKALRLGEELYEAIRIEEEEDRSQQRQQLKRNMRQRLETVTDIELPKSDREEQIQRQRQENEVLGTILKALDRPENHPLKATLHTMIEKNIDLHESGVFGEEMTAFLNRNGLLEHEDRFKRLLAILTRAQLGTQTILQQDEIRGYFHQLKAGDRIRLFDGKELKVSKNNPLQHKIYTDKGKIFSYGQAPGGRAFNPDEYRAQLDQVAELQVRKASPQQKAA